MKSIQLTNDELRVLLTHWRLNMSYGVSGSFGDGDEVRNDAEWQAAERIKQKLERAWNEIN